MHAKDLFVQRASVVLISLASKPIPSGHLYAMMMNGISLDDYTSLVNTLESNGLITSQNYLLSLTDKGKELANKIAKAIA